MDLLGSSWDSWSEFSEDDEAGDCSLTTGWTCWGCFFLDFLCLVGFSLEDGDDFSSGRLVSGVASLVAFAGGRLLSLECEGAGDGVRSLRFRGGDDLVSFFLGTAGFSCGGGVSKRRLFTGVLDRDLVLVTVGDCFGEKDFRTGVGFFGEGDRDFWMAFGRPCFSKMSR